MPPLRRISAIVALAALLAGCRIDPPPGSLAAAQDTPEGYHRMPDGTLMADVQMTTDYEPDRNGDGFSLPTHTRPDGTVVLGAAPKPGDHSGHNHAVPDPDDFPSGVVPIRLVIPRLDLDAPVVATAMTSDRIQGPPVAGDIAWLEQTRRPGEIGPAVLGGVTRIGDQKGAYARLDELRPGDEFVIIGDGGDVLAWRVDQVRNQPVADRSEIFRAGGADPEIRLVAWATDDTDSDHDHVVTALPADNVDPDGDA